MVAAIFCTYGYVEQAKCIDTTNSLIKLFGIVLLASSATIGTVITVVCKCANCCISSANKLMGGLILSCTISLAQVISNSSDLCPPELFVPVTVFTFSAFACGVFSYLLCQDPVDT